MAAVREIRMTQGRMAKGSPKLRRVGTVKNKAKYARQRERTNATKHLKWVRQLAIDPNFRDEFDRLEKRRVTENRTKVSARKQRYSSDY